MVATLVSAGMIAAAVLADVSDNSALSWALLPSALLILAAGAWLGWLAQRETSRH